MKKVFLAVALFLWTLNKQYPVHYDHCGIDGIQIKQGNKTIQVELFNVLLEQEEAYQYVCHLLSKAQTITIEVDPSTNQKEPLPVYLFCDGELVQNKLIEKKLARICIRNPEYTYEKEMEQQEQKTKAVVASTRKEEVKSHAYVAKLYLFVAILIWLCLIGYGIIKYKKKQIK